MKRLFTLLAALLFCLLPAAAFAAVPTTYLNGLPRAMDAVFVDGHMLLSTQDCKNMFGVTVNYFAKGEVYKEDKIRIDARDGKSYSMYPGSTAVICDDSVYGQLPCAPLVKNGKAYVPLRFFADIFYITVGYTKADNAVRLYAPEFVIQDGVLLLYRGADKNVDLHELAIDTLGQEVFWLKGIYGIVWPQNLTKIDFGAFYGCDFTRLQLPDTLTEIGDWAFCNCRQLEYIEIPASVTVIGEQAFISEDELILSERYSYAPYTDKLVIGCYAGSAAEQFAIEHGMNYELLD